MEYRFKPDQLISTEMCFFSLTFFKMFCFVIFEKQNFYLTSSSVWNLPSKDIAWNLFLTPLTYCQNCEIGCWHQRHNHGNKLSKQKRWTAYIVFVRVVFPEANAILGLVALTEIDLRGGKWVETVEVEQSIYADRWDKWKNILK